MSKNTTEIVHVGPGTIQLMEGDITRQRVECIVTAANAELRGGGGVDGAVHRAAGPELLEACAELGGCPTGSAVLTPSFSLGVRGVRYVIHAVGPMWRGREEGEDSLLEGAYRKSLELAEESALVSIAFPSISTGVYGFPVERAAPIAVRTARRFLERAVSVRQILFVLFSEPVYAEFAKALTL